MHASTILGLALTVGAPAAKEASKEAPPAIVGEWRCESFIGGGRVAGAGMLPEIIVEFTADGKFRGREGGTVHPEGTYSVNPAKDPAEVDYASGTTRTNYGIYKVEKDTLTICVAENGGPRPKEFESPEGTRIMLLTFKRVEQKKQ